jgi:Galactose oxidase, central domain
MGHKIAGGHSVRRRSVCSTDWNHKPTLTDLWGSPDTPGGSLNTPRFSHTATLLPDGKVLVAGGFIGDGGLDSAEVYDPATGKWKATGRLNLPRTFHTATLLKDDKVLIVGGSDGYFNEEHCFNGAELYDLKDERWSVTGSLNKPHCFHTATLLKNGKVLVVGGHEVNNLWTMGTASTLWSCMTQIQACGVSLEISTLVSQVTRRRCFKTAKFWSWGTAPRSCTTPTRHVLPEGNVRVKHYGLLASRERGCNWRGVMNCSMPQGANAK